MSTIKYLTDEVSVLECVFSGFNQRRYKPDFWLMLVFSVDVEKKGKLIKIKDFEKIVFSGFFFSFFILL